MFKRVNFTSLYVFMAGRSDEESPELKSKRFGLNCLAGHGEESTKIHVTGLLYIQLGSNFVETSMTEWDTIM